jgi:hypothetical protein
VIGLLGPAGCSDQASNDAVPGRAAAQTSTPTGPTAEGSASGTATPTPVDADRDGADGGTVRFTASGDFGSTTNTAAVLDAVAASASRLHLALGDLSYGWTGAEPSWCRFVTRHVGAEFPFQLISGNHESDGENGLIGNFAACLPNRLPGLVGSYGTQWYVDVPAADPVVRFVMISPGLEFPDGAWSYARGSKRYAWTTRAIDQARARDIPWVVVGMHKPCLSIGNYACDPGRDVIDLLLDRRVDLVLTGHEHLYQRTKQLAHATGCRQLVINAYRPSCVADADDDLAHGAGTVFVTVGTGGIPLRVVRPDDPERRYFTRWSGRNADPTWGALSVQADADTLTADFLRASGGGFADRFTIRR